MGVYLEDNPPARSQFRRTRRAPVTGAIVIHTAENMIDLIGPDAGAEAVASFIARRTDGAGSYHSIVDSDSTVQLCEYEWEAFHEGTGGNRWSLGLSFACRAADWQNPPAPWFKGAIDQGAAEAVRMAQWVKATVGVTVPAVRINRDQYRNGAPGFVSHAQLDPMRRSDPGIYFPWDYFLSRYQKEHAMPDRGGFVAEWQRVLLSHGADLGTTGPNGDGVDDEFGEITLRKSVEVVDYLAGLAADDDEETEYLLARAELGDRAIALIKDAGRFDEK